MESSEKSETGKPDSSYIPAMTPCAWIFHRVDPEENELRFYYVAIQPSLLDTAGQWSVLRFYGRFDGAQHEMAPMQFNDWETAKAFATRLIRTRVRRGYTMLPESSAMPSEHITLQGLPE